jgi:membrane protease YdiL (CAAX protease family)
MSNWIQKNSLVLYFILAYAVSWSFEIPIALSVQGLISIKVPMWIHYFASFGPMIAALILSAVTEGQQGIRNLVARIFKWRVDVRYYVFAVLAPIGLFALAYLLNRLITGEWSDLSLLGLPDYLPYITPLGVLGLWLLTYGLGEETGWRGYALPHLQKTRHAASATLILALVWAFWHLPAFFYRDTYIELGVLGFPMFAISLLFAAMIFTWLYNSTGGSVLLVIIFHAIFNWLSVSAAGGQFVAGIMTVPVVLWALFIPRIYGMENCAPVEKQVA